jgi:hypothetical protein
MAGAGACIVLSGLAVLSFLISMIPRLTGYFEEKAQPPVETAIEESPPDLIVPEKLPDDIQAATRIYATLTADLGDAFTLIDLHRKSKTLGLPHPHLSINRFRAAGTLVSAGKECFSWQITTDK